MGTAGAPVRTAEDERFIESFKQYVDLLVDESCSELMGKEPVPKDKFEEAGHKLVEASRNLKITQKVEDFVGLVNNLAEYRLLAPEPEAVRHMPSGFSTNAFGAAIMSLASYFKNIGLTLCETSPYSYLNDRPIIGMCLGEAKTIDLYVGPKVTVFTKMIIDATSDTINSMELGAEIHTDWTNADGIFHPLEPKLDDSRETWSKLKAYSSPKSMSEKAKLDKLAWTALSLEADGNEEAFSKKYATTHIEDNYLHEIYHNQIVGLQNGTPTTEAAAQLHAISKGRNPLACLRVLYEWKGCKAQKYAHATEEAFRQLEKAGYMESLWTELDPSDTEKVNEVGAEIRRLADLALTNLEAGMGWRNHKEVERELGLERNYSILHSELQKLEDVNYGR